MKSVTKSSVSTTRITASICCPWCSYTWKQVTCFVRRLFQVASRLGQACMWRVLHHHYCFKAVTPYTDNSGHLAPTKILVCNTRQWVTHMQKTTRALRSTHPFPAQKLIDRTKIGRDIFCIHRWFRSTEMPSLLQKQLGELISSLLVEQNQ